jgi:hypothetical protein
MAYAGRREILKATVAVVTAMVGGAASPGEPGFPSGTNQSGTKLHLLCVASFPAAVHQP